MSAVFAVWQRNLLYFRYNLLVSMIWVFVEPIIMLFAIGYGVGGLIGDVDGLPYVEFFLPALMCSSGMMVSFYEGAYGSYTKLAKQKTFDGILMSPIMPNEMALGEIFWAASKGFLSGISVAAVGMLQGLFTSAWILPSFLYIAAICWIFATFGVWLACRAKNYDWFIYIQAGLVTPMLFFSGTYFPLGRLPLVLEYLAWLSPLTHAVAAVRSMFNGQLDWQLFGHFSVLILFCVVLTPVTIRRFERKLIV